MVGPSGSKSVTSSERPPLMIRKLRILLGLTFLLGILFVPDVGTAASVVTVRVAILSSYDGKASDDVVAGIKQTLSPLGSGLVLTVYPLQKSADKAAQAVAGIKANGADLVFALGSLALESIADELPDLPIVATMILREEDIRKYPQATGVPLEFSVQDQFKWMQKFLPAVKKIGVVYNSDENQALIEQAKLAARPLGLSLVEKTVADPKDLPDALEGLANRADVLWGLTDRMVLTRLTAKDILLFSFRNRIPFVGLSESWVEAGALYALDRDYHDIGEQCGELAMKLLRGGSVTTLSPQSPRTVVYSLNMKIARQMKTEFAEPLIKKAAKLY